MHDCVINNVLVIDIPSFCQDMSEAVTEWLRVTECTANYKTNVKNGMQRFPSDVVGISMPSLFVYA